MIIFLHLSLQTAGHVDYHLADFAVDKEEAAADSAKEHQEAIGDATENFPTFVQRTLTSIIANLTKLQDDIQKKFKCMRRSIKKLHGNYYFNKFSSFF